MHMCSLVCPASPTKFQPGCCRQVPYKGMGGFGRTSDCSQSEGPAQRKGVWKGLPMAFFLPLQSLIGHQFLLIPILILMIPNKFVLFLDSTDLFITA